MCPDLTTNGIVRNSMKEQEAVNSKSEDDDCPSSTKDCVVGSKETVLNIETIKKVSMPSK